MSKKIAVIDGNSLMHRAYHAVQTPMTAKDGTPTNAVFGFLSMLCKFIEIASPDAIVCAFDAGKPTDRIEALAQYKAQRPPMDNELRVQFPVMAELLGAMAIPVVKVPGWEGDDILGTIAARDEELGFETLLVTGDKDAYQLATEATRIVTTKKGITDITVNGPVEVEERYGVTPAQFIDYLGLMGDSSDNIPGVPGIGPKTATKLLQAYGSIEGIYEHIGELKGKQRENLENNRETAFLSREIWTSRSIWRTPPSRLSTRPMWRRPSASTSWRAPWPGCCRSSTPSPPPASWSSPLPPSCGAPRGPPRSSAPSPPGRPSAWPSSIPSKCRCSTTGPPRPS